MRTNGDRNPVAVILRGANILDTLRDITQNNRYLKDYRSKPQLIFTLCMAVHHLALTGTLVIRVGGAKS